MTTALIPLREPRLGEVLSSMTKRFAQRTDVLPKVRTGKGYGAATNRIRKILKRSI